jgi:hypothetical protein
MGIYYTQRPCGCLIQYTTYDLKLHHPETIHFCRRHRIRKWFKDLICWMKIKKK